MTSRLLDNLRASSISVWSFPVKGSGEPHKRSSWEPFQACGLHLSWLSFPVGSSKAQTHLRALDLSF